MVPGWLKRGAVAVSGLVCLAVWLWPDVALVFRVAATAWLVLVSVLASG